MRGMVVGEGGRSSGVLLYSDVTSYALESSTSSLRFVLSRGSLFLYSLDPRWLQDKEGTG